MTKTNIQIVQSGQGLLSVQINDKRSDWKIRNDNGIWNLYKMNDENSVCDINFAGIIHKEEQLKQAVGMHINKFESD